MDELVSEVAKEIHYYFDIDDISIVLRSHRKNKLNIYSTHYLDKQHPATNRAKSMKPEPSPNACSKVKRCC